MTAGAARSAAVLDDAGRPSVRELIGLLLARASDASFAIASIRIAGIDLGGRELGGLRRCRVLVGRIDAETFADAEALAARDPARAASLAMLRDFAASGRLELRAAGREVWTPDFSVLRGSFGQAAAVTLIGAHYFARPHPIGGPAFTCAIPGEAPARRAAVRFDELWRRGYDVLPVVVEALDRILAAASVGRDAAGAGERGGEAP